MYIKSVILCVCFLFLSVNNAQGQNPGNCYVVDNCCPESVCEELEKQTKILKWRMNKFSLECEKQCETPNELVNVSRDFDNLQTGVDVVKSELEELKSDFTVLKTEYSSLLEQIYREDIYSIGFSVGVIHLWGCDDYTGFLIGINSNRKLDNGFYLTSDIEMAFGKGESVTGAKLRLGAGKILIQDLLSAEIGIDTLWAGIGDDLKAEQFFLLGDAGLRMHLRPYYVSGHLLLGSEFIGNNSHTAGGAMLHAGIVF